MSEITVVQQVQQVSVTAPGPQGPPGPPGAAGGSVTVHNQPSAAGTWTITHNLNRPVFVTVLDSSGDQVLADVDQSDPNVVSIVFATPTSGKAVVS